MKNIQSTKRNNHYNLLIRQISSVVNEAKKQFATTVNHSIVATYWNIGKYIIEFEQQGSNKAKYGDKLLVNLSKDLTAVLGNGYSKSNLFNMRLFYTRFPIFQAVPGKLSWTHLVEIIRIDDELERNFYIAEAVNENWSSRELIKQKERGLFMQLALGKEKDEVMVQYAMYGNDSNLFVSKYQMYLPDIEDLRKLLFWKKKF